MAAFHPSCPIKLYEYRLNTIWVFPSLLYFLSLIFPYSSFQVVNFCDLKDKKKTSL